MTNNYAKLISILFLWVLVSACSSFLNVGDKNEEVDNTPTPSKNTVEIYILEALQPEVRVVKIEPVPQYNCNGNAEVENKVEKSRSITHVVEVSSELQVSAEGEVTLLGTGVGLGAAIATKLGHSYGSTEDISRSMTVKASPGTHVEHLVRLQEIWEVGTAKVIVNNEETLVPFDFRSDFSITISDTVLLEDCPGNEIIVESENLPISTSEPVAVLEPTLTSPIHPTQVLPTSTQPPTEQLAPTDPSIPPTEPPAPTNTPLPAPTLPPPTNTPVPPAPTLPPPPPTLPSPTNTPVPPAPTLPPPAPTLPPPAPTLPSPTNTPVPPTIPPAPTSTPLPPTIPVSTSYRERYSTSIGTGVFTNVFFSDGMAQYSDPDLIASNGRIQQMNILIAPTGCGIATYPSNRIWFDSTQSTRLSINGKIIGEYNQPGFRARHGTILNWQVYAGDQICLELSPNIEYLINIGPDVDIHYDSYCFRGYC